MLKVGRQGFPLHLKHNSEKKFSDLGEELGLELPWAARTVDVAAARLVAWISHECRGSVGMTHRRSATSCWLSRNQTNIPLGPPSACVLGIQARPPPRRFPLGT